MKDPYGRRGRMLSDIAEFDFGIEHIEGKRNVLADTLSCLGFDKLDEDTGSDPPVACVTAVQNCKSLDQPTVPPHWPDMQQAQTADPVVSEILQWVTTGVRPPYEAIQRRDYQIKAFWHKYDELFLHGGLLFRASG